MNEKEGVRWNWFCLFFTDWTLEVPYQLTVSTLLQSSFGKLTVGTVDCPSGHAPDWIKKEGEKL